MYTWNRVPALVLLVAGLWVTHVAAARTFLPPSVAFHVTARRISASRIEVDFRIARGYLLDRRRISIRAARPTIKVAFSLPAGTLYRIPYVAPETVYKGTVAVQVAVTGKGAPGALVLHVALQGCAEAGICYPPELRTLSVPPAR